MNKTLEKVRAKIIEAVPEIEELDFGCRLLVDGDGIDTVAWLSQKEGEQVLVHAVGDKDGVPMSWIKRHCEVLGRPVTLADVLRAIHAAKTREFKVEPDGYMTFEINDEGNVTCETWNLALPLDEQASEVVEFIGKVLGV